MRNDKVKLYHIVTGIPQGLGYYFRSETSGHGFIVGEDNDRFRRTPENMRKFFECKKIARTSFAKMGIFIWAG